MRMHVHVCDSVLSTLFLLAGWLARCCCCCCFCYYYLVLVCIDVCVFAWYSGNGKNICSLKMAYVSHSFVVFIQCRLHISLSVYGDRVLCTHTLSHFALDRIRVFRWPNTHKHMHTHTHTHSPKWRGCFFSRADLPKRMKKRTLHKNTAFFGQWCVFFPCVRSHIHHIAPHPNINVNPFECVHHFYAYIYIYGVLLLVFGFFFTFFPYYFCQTLKFAHNYILNNLNRQREKSNEKLEKIHPRTCVRWVCSLYMLLYNVNWMPLLLLLLLQLSLMCLW